MQTVETILRSKGDKIIAVRPTDSVLDALGIMAEHDVGSVLVMDNGNPVGILTERDYARKVVLLGRSSRESLISEVMTQEVVCVSPERSVDECLALMTNKRIRHLPVKREKQVVGVISIGDLVKATIAEQEFTITQLQMYIAG